VGGVTLRRIGMNHVIRAVLSLAVALAAGGLVVCADPAPAPRTCSTALLVIDVQEVYVSSLDLTTVDGVPLVPRLIDVLAAARAAGVPVIYIQHRDPRYAPDSPFLNTVAPIAPLAGDPVVWKATPDSFRGTELADILAGLGVRRVLISGLATTGCVNATAFGAFGLGYETWVIRDAHSGGGTPDVLAYYNESWPTVGITVTSSKDIDFASFGCPSPATP
jgi:nicotinamidase-related amidase